MLINISKETLTRGVNVILRVPSLFIAEAWYRTSLQSMQALVYPGRARQLDSSHQLMLKTLYYSSKSPQRAQELTDTTHLFWVLSDAYSRLFNQKKIKGL